MLANPQPPRIHLPKGWQDCVKSAVLHAIALAHYAIVYVRWLTASQIRALARFDLGVQQANQLDFVATPG